MNNAFTTISTNLLLTSWLIMLAACSEEGKPAMTDMSAAADDDRATEGWTELFDGETLSGWRSFKGESPPPGWVVENGALVLAEPGGGDILSAGTFANFELEFEWRISENGNSGVIYLVNETDGARNTYETGLEYQVLDNDGHPDGEDPSHRSAALYDLVAPPHDVTRPIGAWNAARIVVQGERIEHWLNGEKVVDSPFDNDEWRSMVAVSKFRTMPEFGVRPSGHFALQDHGDRVWYRNIRIREK